MLQDEIKTMALRVGIEFPTILPFLDYPIDRARLVEWRERQRYPSYPYAYSIASKLIDNINYIDFDRFIAQLRITVDAFNAALPAEADYVLWLSQDRQDKLARGCSEQWVAGLALEHCGLRSPKAIVTTGELADYLDDNPSVTSVLLLDDAAYSGTHLDREINQKKQALKSKGRRLYLGVPFLAERALTKTRAAMYRLSGKELLANLQVGRGACVTEFETSAQIAILPQQTTDLQYMTVLPFERIPLLGDCLNEAEIEATKAFFRCSPDLSLTYFSHKLPDFFSTSEVLPFGSDLLKACQAVAERLGIHCRVEEISNGMQQVSAEFFEAKCLRFVRACKPLVSEVVEPYKLERDPQAIDKLQRILAKDDNRVLVLDSRPVPERFADLREALLSGKQPLVVEASRRVAFSHEQMQVREEFQLQLQALKAIGERLQSKGKWVVANWATQLSEDLRELWAKFEGVEITLEQFKTAALNEVATARPHLERYTGLKQLLANVVLAIVGVGVIYGAAILVNKAFTGRYLFFNNEAVDTVDNISLEIEKLPPNVV